MLVQVREATSILDIDVLFYPCPKGGPTWRPKVRKCPQTSFHGDAQLFSRRISARMCLLSPPSFVT